ncbi:MAG: D-2-hydroxyacid dehydrogenase [Proteobacteria bacterium]|nr:D-2-hydroxyacid dehydrogenase [Pseudomonadota bacterium]
MAEGTRKLVIAHDLDRAKYYPLDRPLPYEGSPRMLRDVIARLLPETEVSLGASAAETAAALADADGLVARRLPRAWFEAAPRLAWVQTLQAGVDHFFALSEVAPDELRRRGIVVTSGAGAASVSVSEQVLAYMFMFARQMHRCVRWQLERRFDPFTAGELSERTVGVISLGTIGERVARLCKCLGMRAIGTKRDPAGYRGAADEAIPFRDHRRVFEAADYLVLAVRLADETRGMVNARSLAWMKPGAVIINVGRGLLIDEAALVDALKRGVIAGAGLDTHGPQVPIVTEKDQERLCPESELWALENVIITPNHASGSPRVFEYLGRIVAENARRLARGEAPINRVL